MRRGKLWSFVHLLLFHVLRVSKLQYTSLLGTKLSDRRLELDSMRDDCIKTDETFCLLATFLDKIERQMLRDSVIPHSRDDTDRQIRSVNNMVEDLNDKQLMLDNLESQVGVDRLLVVVHLRHFQVDGSDSDDHLVFIHDDYVMVHYQLQHLSSSRRENWYRSP